MSARVQLELADVPVAGVVDRRRWLRTITIQISGGSVTRWLYAPPATWADARDRPMTVDAPESLKTAGRAIAIAPSTSNAYLAATMARAEDSARRSRAESTLRAYASDRRDFERYCASVTAVPYPATPETLVMYLTHLADRLKILGDTDPRLYRESERLDRDLRHV